MIVTITFRIARRACCGACTGPSVRVVARAGRIAVIANILIIAIFALLLLVLCENTFAASTITVGAGQRVISTGPNAHVRHPMFAGGALLIFAIPIALGSFWGMLPAALAIPFLIARILDEERTLSAELPGYDDYCLAVPYRLIPLVWSASAKGGST